MRYLMLGLILTNVLYWAWSQYIDVPQTTVSAQRPTSQVPSLELVNSPRVGGNNRSTSDAITTVVEKIGADDVIDIDQIEQDGTLASAQEPSVEPPITVSSNLARPPPARSSTSTQRQVATTAPDVTASNAILDNQATSETGRSGSSTSASSENRTTNSISSTDSGGGAVSDGLAAQFTRPVDANRYPDRCVSVGPFANLQQAGTPCLG